jgi:hypothetical protein
VEWRELMQSDQNMSKQAYKVDGCSIMRPSGFIGSSFCYATEITKQMDELSTALHEYEKERDEAWADIAVYRVQLSALARSRA